jgi:hypothetical protein
MKLIQVFLDCFNVVTDINKSGSFLSAPTRINAKYPNLRLVTSAIQPRYTGTSQHYENLSQRTMLVKKIGFINQKRKESGWKNNF